MKDDKSFSYIRSVSLIGMYEINFIELKSILSLKLVRSFVKFYVSNYSSKMVFQFNLFV